MWGASWLSLIRSPEQMATHYISEADSEDQMAYGQSCGKWFARKPNEKWKTLCLESWKESKRQGHDQLKAELEDAREEIECLRDRIRELQTRIWTAQVCKGLIKHQRFPLRQVHPDHNG